MNEPKEREQTIFEATLARSPAERAAFLDQACGGDSALRKRLDLLLRAHERKGLDGPAAFELREAVTLPIVGSEKIGDRIGRYKLLQQIGEGGCGIVYMAEQEEPVRRRVALKVIKLGMDTKSVIARFEAERQALALMDHPNIAKVLDGGATETGRPYFVMELVRGIKITDFCNDSKISNDDRLKLFVQVCQAVHHAHQKGIIHRDLKPSNILVTVNDGVPVPKVIDFGIAKATNQQQLTDKTLFTAFEQFIGTPAYMSPEQAVMTSLDIDTRTDIYSLGVLLYELLTGCTPFDSSELLESGLDALRKTIREREPVKPSARLSTLNADALTNTALHRHTQGERLIHSVRGDLDWIVMKCLEKDRARRYVSASGLAADIERHLQNEPIIARPPSTVYRLQKLALRHQLAAAASAAILISILVGLGFSLWSLRRARVAEKVARQEAEKSQQVARFLKEMLQGVGPSVALGRDTTMLREILNKTATRLDQLKTQPEVEADLRALLGGIYKDLGEYTNAVNMHRAAVDLRQRIYKGDHPAKATGLHNLGEALMYSDVPLEAEFVLGQALEMRRRLFGNDSLEVANTMGALAEALGTVGNVQQMEPFVQEMLSVRRKLLGSDSAEVADALQRCGQQALRNWRFSEAEEMIRQALAIRRKLHGDEHPEVANSLQALGFALMLEGKFQEAEPPLREAVAIRRKILPAAHPQLGIALSCLGDALHQQGKLAEAEAALRETASIMSHSGVERWIITANGYLANVLRSAGKYEEAEALTRQVIAALKAQPPAAEFEQRPGTTATVDYVRSYTMLADLLRKQRKTNELAAAYREGWLGIRVLREKLAEQDNPLAWSMLAYTLAVAEDPAVSDPARALALASRAVQATARRDPGTLADLAAALAANAQFKKAADTLREALAFVEALPDDGVIRFPLQQHRDEYSEVLKCYEEGKPTGDDGIWLSMLSGYMRTPSVELESDLREQLAHFSERHPEDPEGAPYKSFLGFVLLKRGKHEEAESFLRKAVCDFEKAFPNWWASSKAVSLLGEAILAQKRYSEAEPFLLKGYHELKARERRVPFIPPLGKPDLQEAIEGLVRLYSETGDRAKLAEWQTVLDEHKKRGAGRWNTAESRKQLLHPAFADRGAL